MKKIFLFLSIILLILSAGFLMSNFNKSLAAGGSSCPSQTTYNANSAILVGEIRDIGGDPNINVWFEWGRSSSLGNSTPRESFYVTQTPFRFCATVANLQPCTTYYYQAVASNSAGTRRGEVYSFTTTCFQPNVDIKANNSDGSITVDFRQPVNISWTSTNAQYCVASGSVSGWSGNKPVTGNQTFIDLPVGSYTFTLTCYGSNNVSSQDSVIVNVRALPPDVRTLPAVETR